MLSFEQKLAIADSFPELRRKDVSLGRVNYHYEASARDKKTVVYHLHPNGNGYVYAEGAEGYETDDKGFVNIRDFSENDLRTVIGLSIRLLGDTGEARTSGGPAREELWRNAEGQRLELKYDEEDAMWYVFCGLNLDGVYETYDEAADYLKEEGFARS